MIPKGLKVGDTFNQNGALFKVLAVIGDDRYSVIRVGDASPDAVVEQPKITKEDVNLVDLPYAQLKKMCAEKGLDAKGSKAELIARLEG